MNDLVARLGERIRHKISKRGNKYPGPCLCKRGAPCCCGLAFGSAGKRVLRGATVGGGPRDGDPSGYLLSRKPWFRCGLGGYAGAQGEPAMTETVATEDRPKRRSARGPALVSASALAEHFGCTRQYIGGGYDQDVCRLRYLAFLRSENRRSPRAAADAEHTAAKAALLRLKIAEKKRELIPHDEAIADMEALVGLFLTGLSGLAARCGGRDLAVRRAIDQAVFEMRVEISEAASKLAEQFGEPLDDA
jgi:hypothetical protein